jgi:hypothetical protein
MRGGRSTEGRREKGIQRGGESKEYRGMERGRSTVGKKVEEIQIKECGRSTEGRGRKWKESGGKEGRRSTDGGRWKEYRRGKMVEGVW